ncbi:MAG: hypothetical protein ACREDK_00700 [Thermoplasmata archaeon]
MTAIEAHLRQREVRRDELYQRARQLRRTAQGAMVHLHEGRDVVAEIAQVRNGTRALASAIAGEARSDEGIVQDALQEGVEACLLGGIVAPGPLPGPDALGVAPEVYLLGLGDVVGEVRRLALHRLAAGEVDAAERYVHLMDQLYRTLMRFDTTRSIVSLKPKQDAARAILERTRGEVTMARLLYRARLAPPSAPSEHP